MLFQKFFGTSRNKNTIAQWFLSFLKIEGQAQSSHSDLTELASDWIKLTTHELQVFGFNRKRDCNENATPETISPALCGLGHEILSKYAKPSGSFTAQEMLFDAIMLQRVLIHFLPSEVLKLKAESIRRNFQTLVGQETYDLHFPQTSHALHLSTQELRVDLDFILSETMSVYLLTPLRPLARGRLLAYCLRPFLLITAVMLLFSALLGWTQQRFDQMAVLAWIPVFGAMGAMISLQQRVENLPSRGDIIRNVIALESSKNTLWTTSIAGGIFAIVINLIFAAKIIEGNLFPAFQFLFSSQVDQPDGKMLADISKMLIWAFIAGFAERIVPDTITRLTRVLQSKHVDTGPRTSPCKHEEREAQINKDEKGSNATLVALGKNRMAPFEQNIETRLCDDKCREDPAT
jgi:hypothetical protein